MDIDEIVPEEIEARPKLERQLGYMFWDDVHPQQPDPPPPRLLPGFDALSKQMKLLREFQEAYLTEYLRPCPYYTLDEVIEALNNACLNVYRVMLTLQWCDAERTLSEKMAKNLSDIHAALNPPAFQARL